MFSTAMSCRQCVTWRALNPVAGLQPSGLDEGRREYLVKPSRSFAVPPEVAHWSLSTLREKLMKIGLFQKTSIYERKLAGLQKRRLVLIEANLLAGQASKPSPWYGRTALALSIRRTPVGRPIPVLGLPSRTSRPGASSSAA